MTDAVAKQNSLSSAPSISSSESKDPPPVVNVRSASHLVIVRWSRTTVRGADPGARISAAGYKSEALDREAQEYADEDAVGRDHGTDDTCDGTEAWTPGLGCWTCTRTRAWRRGGGWRLGAYVSHALTLRKD